MTANIIRTTMPMAQTSETSSLQLQQASKINTKPHQPTTTLAQIRRGAKFQSAWQPTSIEKDQFTPVKPSPLIAIKRKAQNMTPYLSDRGRTNFDITNTETQYQSKISTQQLTENQMSQIRAESSMLSPQMYMNSELANNSVFKQKRFTTMDHHNYTHQPLLVNNQLPDYASQCSSTTGFTKVTHGYGVVKSKYQTPQIARRYQNQLNSLNQEKSLLLADHTFQNNKQNNTDRKPLSQGGRRPQRRHIVTQNHSQGTGNDFNTISGGNNQFTDWSDRIKRFVNRSNYTDSKEQINLDFQGNDNNAVVTPVEFKNTFNMVKGHGEAYVNYTLAEQPNLQTANRVRDNRQQYLRKEQFQRLATMSKTGTGNSPTPGITKLSQVGSGLQADSFQPKEGQQSSTEQIENSPSPPSMHSAGVRPSKRVSEANLWQANTLSSNKAESRHSLRSGDPKLNLNLDQAQQVSIFLTHEDETNSGSVKKIKRLNSGETAGYDRNSQKQSPRFAAFQAQSDSHGQSIAKINSNEIKPLNIDLAHSKSGSRTPASVFDTTRLKSAGVPKPDEDPTFLAFFMEKRYADTLQKKTTDKELRLEIMYRVLKDVLRKARLDLLQLKRDKKNVTHAAVEIKKRIQAAQEKPGLGKTNLANKVKVTEHENSVGTQVMKLDSTALDNLHPDLKRVVEHLIHTDARQHNRYCPCCRRYEQGKDFTPRQMGEFLEYVRQLHLKLNRGRGRWKKRKGQEGDELPWQFEELEETGEFDFTKTLPLLDQKERKDLRRYLAEMRAVQKIEAPKHSCPPKERRGRRDPSRLDNGPQNREMVLNVSQEELDAYPKTIAAHQFSCGSVDIQADEAVQKENEMQTVLIEKMTSDQQVDIYDLNAFSRPERSQQTNPKIGFKEMTSVAVGTDYNRQMLTCKDWYYSDLNRQMIIDYYRTKKLEMSQSMERKFNKYDDDHQSAFRSVHGPLKIQDDPNTQSPTVLKRFTFRDQNMSTSFNPNNTDRSQQQQQQQQQSQQQQQLMQGAETSTQLKSENVFSDSDDKILSENELQYLARVLKADAKEWQDKEKLRKLHAQCGHTIKSMVREMVEGCMPVCLALEQYKPDKRKDVIRFIYRAQKQYQIKDEVVKILALLIKLEHDPERAKRTKAETSQLLRRLRGLINNFMTDHKQYHVIFLYNGNNMIRKIQKDLRDLEVQEEAIDDATRTKIDREIKTTWKETIEMATPTKEDQNHDNIDSEEPERDELKSSPRIERKPQNPKFQKTIEARRYTLDPNDSSSQSPDRQHMQRIALALQNLQSASPTAADQLLASVGIDQLNEPFRLSVNSVASNKTGRVITRAALQAQVDLPQIEDMDEIELRNAQNKYITPREVIKGGIDKL